MFTFEGNIYESTKDVENICDEKFYLLIEKSLRAGLSIVHGPWCFKPDGDNVGTHDDVENLYRLSLTQFVAYAEKMFDKSTCLETIITTPNNSAKTYPELVSKDNESAVGEPKIKNPETLVINEFCAFK